MEKEIKEARRLLNAILSGEFAGDSDVEDLYVSASADELYTMLVLLTADYVNLRLTCEAFAGMIGERYK